jgi:hypothetical protein
MYLLNISIKLLGFTFQKTAFLLLKAMCTTTVYVAFLVRGEKDNQDTGWSLVILNDPEH